MSEIQIKLRKLHPAQRRILEEAKRFNVLKCGRRFGKTDLSKELTVQPMLDGFPVGYWTPTYKDLDKVWDEICFILHDVITDKDSQLKKLKIATGGTLDMWSMDDPNSGRGFFYKRVIIDEAEKAKKLKEAWEQTIRATLVDLKGDAWFMSTPKFGLTYFKDVLYKNEQVSDIWKSFKFTTFDNPFIDPNEIKEAQKLDDLTFRCEYLAEDVDVSLNPFAVQWDDDRHQTKTNDYHYSRNLIMSVDFNLTPFCVTFWHEWTDASGEHVRMFDEAEIQQGSIPSMIDYIKARYEVSLATAILTGDAMGKRGDISQRDNASLYKQLLRGLGMREGQLKVSSNPTHENSKADFNYVLMNHPDFKIYEKCQGTIRDMRNVQVDATGKIIKGNRNDLNQRADYLDTGRYFVHNIMRKWIERDQKTKQRQSS